MTWWKIILIVVTLFNLMLSYSLCVVSGQADDAAEKMRMREELEDDGGRQYSGLLTDDEE